MAIFKADDKKKELTTNRKAYPVLPLRDIVVFPYMVVPLFVGRERSINALEDSMNREKEILLASQKNAKTDNPSESDIYQMGTLSIILQLLRLPDGTIKALVEGKRRARIVKFISTRDILFSEVEEIHESHTVTREMEAIIRGLINSFEAYVKLNKKVPPEMVSSITSIGEPGRLADTIATHLNLKMEDKQRILEMDNVHMRLEKLYEVLNSETEVLQIEKKLRGRVKKQMEKTQKEYYLNEQMRAIQKELGQKDEFKGEIQELEERLKGKELSAEAKERVEKELKKLKIMSPMSAETTVVRNYIDWILSLPWNEYSEEKLDIDGAERILDEDHYGLEKVKERVIEFLAVQKLVNKMKGPILCFVGPPGVGKTSLARSVARATGRKFVKVSLGGVRDEAEIRGHRRTYIGSLPGKIIQSLKKAGKNNPVFLLDEIDKMSMDFRGDPSAALMEVLDPEQNVAFDDHYLELEYDLSRVMFITTANTIPAIPIPLQDRLEILRMPGYTELEKLVIAKRHIIPKQMKMHGLKKGSVMMSDSTILTIVRRYTREAGVRNMEREIATLLRKTVKEVVRKGNGVKRKITVKKLPKYLGVYKYKLTELEEKDTIGMCMGLAWTEFGGELLNTEVTVMPGKGKLIVTGKLGEVMQESAQAAMSYVRSRCERLNLKKDFYQNTDIHIHLPEGAIPKDGPSAGITMATAIVSALTRHMVRRDVAMTGEITLRGRVLPIGGLKEKLLAAHRSHIKKVIIPKDNEKDLTEIPKKIIKSLEIIPVTHMDEALRNAIVMEDVDELFKDIDRPFDVKDSEGIIGEEQREDEKISPVTH